MKTNRRDFLERSIQGAMGATLGRSGVASLPKTTAASHRVIVGVMGLGGRGCFLAKLFAQRPDVEIAYVCDVHPERREDGVKAVAEVTGKKPKAVDDFRTLLDDRHLDA